MIEELASNLVVQGGFAGIFVLGTLLVYKDGRKRDEMSDQRIKEKDDYIRDINAQVLTAFKENATANTKLSVSLEENTKVMRTLNGRLYDAIVRKNKV